MRKNVPGKQNTWANIDYYAQYDTPSSSGKMIRGTCGVGMVPYGDRFENRVLKRFKFRAYEKAVNEFDFFDRQNSYFSRSLFHRTPISVNRNVPRTSVAHQGGNRQDRAHQLTDVSRIIAPPNIIEMPTRKNTPTQHRPHWNIPVTEKVKNTNSTVTWGSSATNTTKSIRSKWNNKLIDEFKSPARLNNWGASIKDFSTTNQWNRSHQLSDGLKAIVRPPCQTASPKNHPP
jgi:hypothetical protein